eukprot:7768377-Ditylum_brightwellii.AAC.1
MECFLQKLTKTANKEASRIANDLDIIKIEDLNTLYYTVAYTVSLPKHSDNNLPEKSDPSVSYEDKLNQNVEYARKLLGKLSTLMWKDTPPDPKHCHLKGKTLDTALTEACMKLAAATLKLKKYKDREKRLRNSKLFNKSHKLFYDSLRSNLATITNPPPEEDVTKIWTGLFSCTATHNNDATWLQMEEESLQHVTKQKWVDTTPDELCRTICKTKNWKTPGVNLVHNYWYKHLLALQHCLCNALNGVITDPSLLPKWTTLSCTTLLHKKDWSVNLKTIGPSHALAPYTSW